MKTWARAAKRRVWNPVGVVATATIIAMALMVTGVLLGSEWPATFATTIALGITAWVVAESWVTRRETIRPIVSFYVTREDDDILFVLSNSGPRSAYNVQVVIDRPIMFRLGTHDKHDVRELIGFMHTEVPMLAPSDRLRSVNQLRRDADHELGETTVQRFLLPENELITGRVAYQDAAGRTFSETIKIDFRGFVNMKLVTTVTTETTSLNF